MCEIVDYKIDKIRQRHVDNLVITQPYGRHPIHEDLHIKLHNLTASYLNTGLKLLF